MGVTAATGLERTVFCRAYYDAGLSYSEMSALLGVSRTALDEQRREWGLPSRRWLADWLATAGRLAERDVTELELAEWLGPSKHDYVSGRVVQWWLWDRWRLPGRTMPLVNVRVIGPEMYCALR